MVLKKHHKWIIGGSSTIILIFMITVSVFVYTMSIKQELNYNLLDKKLDDFKSETQTNINSLSESVIQTRGELENIESDLGVIGTEFDLLKASAGEDFSGIIETSVLSIVSIKTDESQGTGFIISEQGYVVTNAHVLSKATIIEAITYDQEIIEAILVGYDESIDIALLKIPGNYNALEFGNSDNVQVGENVIAIGNPLGLQFSVTEGIVSAVHREGPNEFQAYIQTDTALNRGNSGGPLINKQGEVIGINNYKIGGSEGIGFALESNSIKITVNAIYQGIYGRDLV